jgi:DNA topoisomerase-2
MLPVNNKSDTDKVHFEIKENKNGIICSIKNLKLSKSINTNNLVLFDSNGKIKKYQSISDIINDFCQMRYSYYEQRKAYLVSCLKKEVIYKRNRSKFLSQVIAGKLELFVEKKSRSREAIITDLVENKFDPNPYGYQVGKEYNYLLDLPVSSFVTKNVEKLNSELKSLKNEYRATKDRTPDQMWILDLDNLLAKLSN